MARLVIVSNRVSLPGERGARAGGLAVALRDVLQQEGSIWFGWSGEIADESSASPHIADAAGVTYATVDLSRADYQGYYLDFANGTLWPLLHYRLGLIEYKRRAFERYLAVNRYLARILSPCCGKTTSSGCTTIISSPLPPGCAISASPIESAFFCTRRFRRLRFSRRCPDTRC